MLAFGRASAPGPGAGRGLQPGRNESADGNAWIWPVECQDIIKQACDCIVQNLTIVKWEKYMIADVRTCPREGSFNRSTLTSLSNDPWGFLTGQP
jgi:hypothetical protein